MLRHCPIDGRIIIGGEVERPKCRIEWLGLSYHDVTHYAGGCSLHDCEINGVQYSSAYLDFENGTIECYNHEGVEVKNLRMKATLSEAN